MFCEKCGNQLPDTAKFCDKCGNEIYNESNDISNKFNDTKNSEVLLEVKPTYKFAYIALPKLLKELITGIPIIIMVIFLISTTNNMTDMVYQIFTSEFMPLILIVIAVTVLRILSIIGKAFFDQKQYQNNIYAFYNDRVIFKDSFLNVSEKELKYKHIREITKKQTFIQRYFNIGDIILFSNAESGLASGIFLKNIENVDDVYKKIKEITNA